MKPRGLQSLPSFIGLRAPFHSDPTVRMVVVKPQAEGHRWRVVGGQQSGGVLVREACSLASLSFAERLAPGAEVVELKLNERRPHPQSLVIRNPYQPAVEGEFISGRPNGHKSAMPYSYNHSTK